MVKTFYVMRHGQTRFNLQGRIQGACDSPLTELGIEQAKSARQHFKKRGHYVYTCLFFDAGTCL